MQFDDLNGLNGFVGQEIGVTDWLVIDQTRIDGFAEVTDDRQWIHLDVKRARSESPYGTTIAHGFLTLSLITTLVRDVVVFRVPPGRTINYGLNRVRFPNPVPAGARVRGRVTLTALEALQDAAQATWSVTVEREGAEKPCCVAEWLVRYYP